MISRERSAALELVGASVFWGFGFIATVWALRSLGPLTLTSYRFLVAFAVSLPFILLFPSCRRAFTKNQALLAFFPGLLLAGTILLQTWGLRYTTATKSGFITSLYVLIVPFLDRYFLGRPIKRLHLLLVLIAVFGMMLIVDLQFGVLNTGDLLTLGCAVIAAFQISILGLVGPRIESPFTFNAFQCFWGGILSLGAVALSDEVLRLPTGTLSVTGMISLTLGSTVLAFMLQVRAQKVLSPSVASLIFLLESPFAALFAAFILDERLSALQTAGAVLIFASALAASRLEVYNTNQNPAERIKKTA